MNKSFLKLTAAIFLVGLFLMPVSLAGAASSDSVTVKVTITPSISVDITETELQLGSVSAGGTKVSGAGVTVTNTGSGVNETYSLSLTNPTGWTAVQDTAAAEKYILDAAFSSAVAGITWDNTKQALSTTPTLCTSTKFAGDQNGVAVPYNTPKTLWFQFKAPTATATTIEQGIVVTVTAQAS